MSFSKNIKSSWTAEPRKFNFWVSVNFVVEVLICKARRDWKRRSSKAAIICAAIKASGEFLSKRKENNKLNMRGSGRKKKQKRRQYRYGNKGG